MGVDGEVTLLSGDEVLKTLVDDVTQRVLLEELVLEVLELFLKSGGRGGGVLREKVLTHSLSLSLFLSIYLSLYLYIYLFSLPLFSSLYPFLPLSF